VTVPRLLDRLGTAIEDAVSASGASVGGAEPSSAGELPTVSLSADSIVVSLAGIGARPAPSRTGALAIDRSIDLADPSVLFPDGSSAELLSADRRRMYLPFGPAVHADGTEAVTLAPGDIDVVVDGTPRDVVETTPAGDEVLASAATGELVFATPLPVTGTLEVSYFVGEWEVRADRFQGELVVDVHDGDSAVLDAISRQVVDVLVPASAGGPRELTSITPLHYGPIEPREAARGNARRRRLVYRFDAEIEDVVLQGGGGPIRIVDVASVYGPEQFEIPVPTTA